MLFGAIAIAVVASIIGYINIVRNYEKHSYNSNSYVDSDQYRDFLLGVQTACDSIEDHGEPYKKNCEKAKQEIAEYVGISDLRAQQTMAYATRGMLVASWFQYMASVGALALVAVTLFATYRMLIQAANTANYARKTLSAAEQATQAAIRTVDAAERTERPFLFTKIDSFAKGAASQIDGRFLQQPGFRITLQNLGKTPAGKVRVLMQFGYANGILSDTTSFSDEAVPAISYIHALDAKESICLREEALTTFGAETLDRTAMGKIYLIVVSLKYQDLIRKKIVCDTRVHIVSIHQIGVDGNSKITHRMEQEDRVLLDWFKSRRDRFFAEKHEQKDDGNIWDGAPGSSKD